MKPYFVESPFIYVELLFDYCVIQLKGAGCSSNLVEYDFNYKNCARYLVLPRGYSPESNAPICIDWVLWVL